MPFNMNKVFFSRKTEKLVNLGKVGKTWVSLYTVFFSFGLTIGILAYIM